MAYQGFFNENLTYFGTLNQGVLTSSETETQDDMFIDGAGTIVFMNGGGIFGQMNAEFRYGDEKCTLTVRYLLEPETNGGQ